MPSILKYLNPIQKSFSHSFAFEDDLAELGISSQVLTPKTQAIPLSVKPDPMVFDRNCNCFFSIRYICFEESKTVVCESKCSSAGKLLR